MLARRPIEQTGRGRELDSGSWIVLDLRPNAGLVVIGPSVAEECDHIECPEHDVSVLATPDSVLEAGVGPHSDAVAVAGAGTPSNASLSCLAGQRERTGVELLVVAP